MRRLPQLIVFHNGSIYHHIFDSGTDETFYSQVGTNKVTVGNNLKSVLRWMVIFNMISVTFLRRDVISIGCHPAQLHQNKRQSSSTFLIGKARTILYRAITGNKFSFE